MPFLMIVELTVAGHSTLFELTNGLGKGGGDPFPKQQQKHSDSLKCFDRILRKPTTPLADLDICLDVCLDRTYQKPQKTRLIEVIRSLSEEFTE